MLARQARSLAPVASVVGFGALAARTLASEAPRRARRVLVAVDPTKGSQLAFERAAKVVGADDELVIFTNGPPVHSTVEFQMSALDSVIGRPDMGVSRAVETQLQEVSARYVDRVRAMYEDRAKSFGVRNISWQVGDADAGPRAEIVRLCEELDVDLCVLGSHGDVSPIKRVLLGSTADYVAHHVHCDVLIVKAKQAPEASS